MKNKNVRLALVLFSCMLTVSVKAQEETATAVVEAPAYVPEPELPTLVPYLRGKLWGFADTGRHIVIEPKFDSAEFFIKTTIKAYSCAKAMYKGRMVYVNRKGEIAEATFSMQTQKSYNDDPLKIPELPSAVDPSLTKDGKYGFRLDMKRRRVYKSPVYSSVITCLDNGKTALLRLESTGKIGLVDSLGTIIIPFEYDSLLTPAGKAGNELFVMKKGDKAGVINKNNKIIVPFEYTNIRTLSYYKFDRLLLYKNGKATLVDENNKRLFGGELINPTFSNGYLRAETVKGSGYLDKDGKVVVPLIYKEVKPFGAWPAIIDYAWVTNKKGVSFFINTRGEAFYSEK